MGTNLTTPETYIRRALDLARLGAQNVSPNPMVGAVIVHDDRIIGEGWYKTDGASHAEVNAANSVRAEDRHLLTQSTIYVSLEPCTIHGRTPPCTDLIKREKIPKVVISTVDKTEGVDGSSQSVLEAAGCTVTTNILKVQGDQMAIIRNTFVSKKRPYIILKWAASADGFIGQKDKQVWLTNPISKRLVHKWRSETDAILIGTNTAKVDNPRLTTRLYFGDSPLRVVLDKRRRIPPTHHVFQDGNPSWIVTDELSFPSFGPIQAKYIDFDDKSFIPNVLEALAKANKSSLIVEGGAKTLQTFIEMGLWDEARIFQTEHYLGSGIAAPKIDGILKSTHQLLEDKLVVLHPKNDNIG